MCAQIVTPGSIRRYARYSVRICTERETAMKSGKHICVACGEKYTVIYERGRPALHNHHCTNRTARAKDAAMRTDRDPNEVRHYGERLAYAEKMMGEQ